MKTIAVTLFALCVRTLCFSQTCQVDARLTGFKDGTVFYLRNEDSGETLDSAKIRDGHVVCYGSLSSVHWLTLSTQRDYVNLLIKDEKILIEGDKKDFPFDLSITGSKNQDIANIQNNLVKDYYKRRDILTDQIMSVKGDSADAIQHKIWLKVATIDSITDLIRLNFIKNHVNSYSGLQELFFLKNHFSRDSLKKIHDELEPTYKNSDYGKRIATYLRVGPSLKQGDYQSDFEAFDRDGMSHKLSELSGKYILIDFSTTYCGPCIESLGDLRLIEAKYAGRLAIVSVSGDVGKDVWLKGLNRDKPQWLSLWDGKGTYGDTFLKYGISSFPTFVVIDPSGKILAKWPGYGTNADGSGSLKPGIDRLLGINRVP